jgi:Protein of unknown function (DUF4246)
VEKDYHPGSNDQVVNLVHPSLFCLVYGKSTDTEGNVIEHKKFTTPPGVLVGLFHASQMWSERYQWLPAEFLVDLEGKVKIGSYINSLPFQSGLYPIIAEIFGRIVPLFNRVLTDLRLHIYRRRFSSVYDWWGSKGEVPYPPREIYKGVKRSDWEMRLKKRTEWEAQLEIDPLPIPGFVPEQDNDDPVELKGHRLQVIVKIGSIELTPEKPTFPGGKWHVEVFWIVRIPSEKGLLISIRVWRMRR